MARTHITIPDLVDKDIARFWSYVDKKSPEECWQWMLSSDSRGYGEIRLQNRLWRSSRVAYHLRHGSIPSGMHVLHKCDNPLCCNPDHLFAGTNFDNMQDMLKKGRGKNRFTKRPNVTRLTAEQVREIRKLHAAGSSSKVLGKTYRIDPKTVSRIVNRHTWKLID